jgi:cytochrome b561
MPRYAEDSAFAASVHGPLLLMTIMAGTGSLWSALQPSGEIFETIHKLLANLVWVYLIAHAGLAIVHHLRREASLGEMWSLRGRNRGDQPWI